MGLRSTYAAPSSTAASASSRVRLFRVLVAIIGVWIPHTGSRMFGIVFIALIAIPIIELYVIVQVGQEIGVLPTLALLVVVSVAGAWLLRQQGTATWRRLQETLRRGEMPSKEVTDGALILLGGALLLTPGFVTDAVGLVLLFPVTRAVVKRVARRFLWQVAAVRFGPAGVAGKRVYDARVTRVRRPTSPQTAPANPSLGERPASSGTSDGEGDSPDKG